MGLLVLLVLAVLHPWRLWLFAVRCEVASEDLFEEYRQPSYSAVVDPFNLMSNEVFSLVAEGDHQLSHFL
jgi:hypothetical protein